MKIYNKCVTSANNQKEVSGQILTSKQFKLVNDANNGRSPLDTDWDKNEYCIIAAGTMVDYFMQETHTGNQHNISIRKDGVNYSKNIVIKKEV